MAEPKCNEGKPGDCTLQKKVEEIHEALLGGTFKNPTGIVHSVKRHQVALYGEDGKGGLVKMSEDVTKVKVVSRAAWVFGGILITLFGSSVAHYIQGVFGGKD